MKYTKILVVEDEAILAMELQKMLKLWGYIPFTAISGEEAIEKAVKIKPDLILMDIELKGKINGIEAIQQINDLFDIPAIYITAHSHEGILELAKTTKPFAYLIKPIDEKQLKINIKSALQSKIKNGD